MSLPVQQLFEPLTEALQHQDVILTAPPGAGKSTCLPLHLLTLPQYKTSKIIMLQPRRIAVRNIAMYLAEQLGESVGQTVGYRVRGEQKVSAQTRLEIVTEGVLLRQLQHDPELSSVSLVIFDEFHERNIFSDFSLALCLDVKQALRDDLRLLIMSATLDVQALQQFMPDAECLECEGRSYPVDIQYSPLGTSQKLADKVAQLCVQSVNNNSGDILVFLPGKADIQRCAEHLLSVGINADVHQLYGELNKAQQQAALKPAQHRKIILATNIAETSLTIEGIKLVIDSGLEKHASFDLNKGMTQLKTVRISQASATQRAGRAGRLSAGVCIRLWEKESHSRLAKDSTPDILTQDLSPFLLESLVWGTPIDDLSLLTQPTAAQLSHATQWLSQLSALDQQGRVTSHGRTLQQTSSHPTLANMLHQSKAMGEQAHSLACAIAAIVESRDRASNQHGTVSGLLYQLQQNRQHPLWKEIHQWHARQNISITDWNLDAVALLLCLAFPHWIAQQRRAQSYLLANGCGAALNEQDPLTKHPYLVVVKAGWHEKKSDADIYLAEPLDIHQFQLHFSTLIDTRQQCEWVADKQQIIASEQAYFGKLKLGSAQIKAPSQSQCADIWHAVLEKQGLGFLPLSERCQQLIRRLAIAQQCEPALEWPDFDEQTLLAEKALWLLPYIQQYTSAKQLGNVDFYSLLLQRLDWQQQQHLQQHYPEKLALPTGENATVDYSANGDVTISARMQQFFGLLESPSIAQGRKKVIVELLSPARRPLQKTADLAGFWQGCYQEVKKEMKGRYPKHYWPDNPAIAEPTTKTKKHMQAQKSRD
ncbi:ATP-dependent helicase HrpB [Neptunicella marina]|uniref:ATP-dependent helicase HrpB n=1 Tax=Neptunicella marina TaxID=2125989 RepID=A0A8J6ISU0_9ALTE|nr:ATP-dependent helicase HrpB [Neptunicella marina]